MTEDWIEKSVELGAPLSVHTYGGWKNQFARMDRWYQRIQLIAKRLEETGKLSVEDMDYILAYFQNCYHLKDWLKYEKVVDENDIEKWVNEISKPLMLCKVICNGSKHFILNDEKRAKRKHKESVYKDFQIGRGALPWGTEEHWFVRADGEQHDIFELASECQREWKKFLDERGIWEASE
jgi:hypothetical protein